MKKIVTFAFLLFWSVLISLLAAYFVASEMRKDGGLFENAGQFTSGFTDLKNNQVASIGGILSSATEDFVLDMTELKKHNSDKSCWLLISGKIYDVTKFLKVHPGGAKEILSSCGTDATSAFATENKNPPKSHSSSAGNMLDAYYIGDLGAVFKKAGANSAQAAGGTAGGDSLLGSNTQFAIPDPTAASSGTFPVNPSSVGLTSSEVGKHASQNDCWMIVENKVYDFTSYLSAHPGGVGQMLPYCGKDGTSAFATRGGTGTHSNSANALLANYFVGDLNATITRDQVGGSSSSTLSTPPPKEEKKKKDEDEEEDDD